MSDAPSVNDPTFPTHITHDPAGIDMFAAVLHAVYAVRHLPQPRTMGDLHDYLMVHIPKTVRFEIHRADPMRGQFEVVVSHPGSGRNLHLHIDATEPPATCLCARTPTGDGWVRLLLDNVSIRSA